MLAQLIVSGVALGAIYALVALSMTVVYRATTVLNFGHGDLVMAGAFIVYVLVLQLGIPYLPAALSSLGLLFLLGLGMQRGLIQRMRGGPHIALVMMTISVGYLLRGIARMLWGRDVLPMPRAFTVPPLLVGNVVITGDDLVITGSVFILTALFFLIFYRTELGKRVQAVSQSERGAALVGINVPRIHGTMWGVGAAMGALGGALIAPVTLLYPDMGAHLLIRGFAAMSLGGFGSLWGAVIGGVLMGVIEHLSGFYLSTALIDIAAYLIIIVVLVVRPAGLLGRQVAVRV
ncbi:MAG TPA: branched-chain amino acid ABC transporter permease [Xanthobacteraceae bacterium]|jgi:branched-chain amino acid transport system permease protein